MKTTHHSFLPNDTHAILETYNHQTRSFSEWRKKSHSIDDESWDEEHIAGHKQNSVNSPYFLSRSLSINFVLMTKLPSISGHIGVSRKLVNKLTKKISSSASLNESFTSGLWNLLIRGYKLASKLSWWNHSSGNSSDNLTNLTLFCSLAVCQESFNNWPVATILTPFLAVPLV